MPDDWLPRLRKAWPCRENERFCKHMQHSCPLPLQPAIRARDMHARCLRKTLRRTRLDPENLQGPLDRRPSRALPALHDTGPTRRFFFTFSAFLLLLPRRASMCLILILQEDLRSLRRMPRITTPLLSLCFHPPPPQGPSRGTLRYGLMDFAETNTSQKGLAVR